MAGDASMTVWWPKTQVGKWLWVGLIFVSILAGSGVLRGGKFDLLGLITAPALNYLFVVFLRFLVVIVPFRRKARLPIVQSGVLLVVMPLLTLVIGGIGGYIAARNALSRNTISLERFQAQEHKLQSAERSDVSGRGYIDCAVKIIRKTQSKLMNIPLKLNILENNAILRQSELDLSEVYDDISEAETMLQDGDYNCFLAYLDSRTVKGNSMNTASNARDTLDPFAPFSGNPKPATSK
jgi:hypothetical protein